MRYVVDMSSHVFGVVNLSRLTQLDPTMMEKDDNKDKNVERLQYFITTTVNLILNTAADCPP